MPGWMQVIGFYWSCCRWVTARQQRSFFDKVLDSSLDGQSSRSITDLSVPCAVHTKAVRVKRGKRPLNQLLATPRSNQSSTWNHLQSTVHSITSNSIFCQSLSDQPVAKSCSISLVKIGSNSTVDPNGVIFRRE